MGDRTEVDADAVADGMAGVGRLPTFLLIGAMKAGTTSLFHYLRAHPQIFFPAFKAPEFFAESEPSARSLARYRKLFAPARPEHVMLGEASNVYTKYPVYPGVPERIAQLIPGARLVYVVRDPIERIRSHYQTRVSEGSERAPLAEAVLEEPSYVAYSRYAMQLERYLAHFPRQQIHVMTAEDLRDDRSSAVSGVYRFLGVDPAVRPDALDREFYRTGDRPTSIVPLKVRKMLKRRLPALKRFKELENNINRTLRRRDPAPRFEVDEATRARLVEELAPDVERLREIMGDGFDGWGLL